METYKEKAKNARLKILDMVYAAQTSHIGSNFSVVDILTVLFDKIDLNKDKVILSAGWKAAAFYYFLAEKGLFSKEKLDTYCQPGSDLIGLTEPGIPGVLFAGGSMQMGLPAAVGFALSKKLKKEEGTVYCILSDGELAGGMIWESLALAQHYKLNNLVIVVDNNGLQAMGDTKKILHMPKLEDKFGSFINSANVLTADGNDYWAIDNAFTVMSIRQNKYPEDNNLGVVIFNTTKGKGVSFMEGNNDWHYRNIPEDLYIQAKEELVNG